MQKMKRIKEIFYQNKKYFLFLDNEIRKKSNNEENTYQELWENFINGYYADSRTIEKFLIKKDDHALVHEIPLEKNIKASLYERAVKKNNLINGTFLIENNKNIDGYANIRFLEKESILFLNLVFFDDTIKKKGFFRTLFKEAKIFIEKRYQPKIIYFYTTPNNKHLFFWEKEAFKIQKTENKEKIKLIYHCA
jgi:hypothetical protein